MRGKLIIVVWVFLFMSSDVFALPSFPGAEGYGAEAVGGRSGMVYRVTSLADSGPGTLRECAEASGPRMCLILVDGDIVLASHIQIDHPNISIIGQTAPAQGIQLRHGTNIRGGIFINASHVVIRHIAIRLGPTQVESDTGDCINFAGTYITPTNLIGDHITCMWGTDELSDVNVQDATTISNSVFAWGLHDSSHTSGKHSRGPNLRGAGVSLIGNVIANNLLRNPNIVGGKFAIDNVRNGGTPSGAYEIRNNFIFNGQNGFADWFTGRGDTWLNFVGNRTVRGPSTRIRRDMPYGLDAREHGATYFDQDDPTPQQSGVTDEMHLCIQGNHGEGLAGNPDSNNPQRDPALHGVLNPNDAHLVESTDCVNNPVYDPQDIATYGAPRGLTGSLIPVADLELHLMNNAGAIPWNRDLTTLFLFDQIANRQGAIIDHPSEVGGWPVLASGTAPVDTDADGIPDSTETACGWSPTTYNPWDDADGDGYGNLEEYVNYLAQDQPTICNAVVIPEDQTNLTMNVSCN